MKAIHNYMTIWQNYKKVVVYPKDTEKWKQFTTNTSLVKVVYRLLCIPKILKNESNSQRSHTIPKFIKCCCVSQRYWKMKAIHNTKLSFLNKVKVVVYPKDTEKWKQFTTYNHLILLIHKLLCIPKILKNESNSQHKSHSFAYSVSCCVSQRYWKMKAIHN